MQNDYGSRHNASPGIDDDNIILRILRQQHASALSIPDNLSDGLPVPFETPESQDLFRRPLREAVTGLPRAQTFKRQQSERRINLTPVETSLDERRATSSDRRLNGFGKSPLSQNAELDFHGDTLFDPYQSYIAMPPSASPLSMAPSNASINSGFPAPPSDAATTSPAFDADIPLPDTTGMPGEEYDDLIHEELERVWILNLSMHFRDRSQREKFFVTFRQKEHLWRRVTISMDYRNAPPDSLEADLHRTQYQRDKSARIYRSIRDSLSTIEWYDTVTNLKLQTNQGQLHIHVVEDGNEIISYPDVSLIRHLGCKLVRESQISFESHMSGFVYKVRYNGNRLIKKEIPGQDTVDEFLYEVNALHNLLYSKHTIHFHGLVVDDSEKQVKGLLIAYAEQGALVDIIYDECKDANRSIPWDRREKWARQIIHGLADIHDSGFVQGDFTVSNVVIDDEDDAKIIDVNRRGCPIGWEPPEATALVESNQRLSLYIGVKSDLYQLGMVLWALAMEEDEPEIQGRPLVLGPEVNVPDWYRQITEICLNYDPRSRLGASYLIEMIPGSDIELHEHRPSQIAMGKRPDRTNDTAKLAARPLTYDPNYTTRGRSPPSPTTSNTSTNRRKFREWSATVCVPASYSDTDDVKTGNTGTTWQGNLIPTPGNGQPYERPQMEPSGNMLALSRPSSANNVFDRRNPAITVPHATTHEPLDEPADSTAVRIDRTTSDETVHVSRDKVNGRPRDVANPKTGGTMYYSSRPSTPDGELDGGAELSRSEAEFSTADRAFDDGEYMRCSGQDTAKRSADGGHARNEALSSALAGIGAAHMSMRNGVVNG